jgi:nucleoside-diphosphate-sugar epimerase
VERRVPSITRAETILGWHPTTDFSTCLRKTVDFYLRQKQAA